MSGSDGAKATVGHVPLSEAVKAALQVSAARGERVFLVGGIVRDLMMGRGLGDYDLDLVVEGDGLAFAKALRDHLSCELRQHPSFLTSKLTGPFSVSPSDGPLLTEVDVATSRTEEYSSPGALPTVKAAPIEQDLWRRDFSVNALALPLLDYARLRAHEVTPEQVLPDIVDSTGGLGDLRSKTLRVLHPESFVDDPTRLFRAVRYEVRLGFEFDLATAGAFLNAVKSGALATLSARRIWNEAVAALDEERTGKVFEEFVARGLFSTLPVVTPERLPETVAALGRLGDVRDELDPEVAAAAGKLLLVAGLVRDGREDIVLAVQEGSKAVKRARAVLDGIAAGQAPSDLVDLVAAYALAGSEALRMALESALQGGGD